MAAVYSSPSILQRSILRPPLVIRPLDLVPKGNMLLNDLYFKTTCNIRPHFLRPMGGLKIEGPLYMCTCNLYQIWMLKYTRIKSKCVSEYIDNFWETDPQMSPGTCTFFLATLYFKTTLIIRPLHLVTKRNVILEWNLFFKTVCNIRPHFHGPIKMR